MDKLEVLSRAWIDCDPNRAGNPLGSGFHPDDIMEGYQETELRNAKGEVVAVSSGGSDEMKGLPRWRWFLPRAVFLEDYLERHGFVVVKLEQVQRGGAVGAEFPTLSDLGGNGSDKEPSE